MKIELDESDLPRLDSIMKCVYEINDLIAIEYEASRDWKSSKVEVVNPWGSTYFNISYDSSSIEFQFLEKLSKIVGKHGYFIKEQERFDRDSRFNTRIRFALINEDDTQ